MGVVNVTPDSFSDGGAWFDPTAAIAHGMELAAQGADIVDIGGESTRPGADRPAEAEELHRILPVVSALAGAGIAVSVDTMRAAVAAAALDAGARMVNDVSGGLADPEMAAVVADAGVEIVVMHWRGHSADMQSRAHYDDVVEDVCRELTGRVAALVAAGVDKQRIILDPGLGFAKTPEHNWALLRALPRLAGLGHRLLLGTSRKRFLGVVGRDEATIRNPLDRDVATAVTSAHAASAGIWGLRVHDIVATRDALDVAAALGGWPQQPGGPAAAPPATARAGATSRAADRTDAITLTGLRAKGFHGVFDFEKATGQEFVVDVTLHADLRTPGRSDDLDDTVSYADVAELAVARITGPSFDLIEALAESIAAEVLTLDGVRETVVTVHKPTAPIPHTFGDVSVTVHRAAPAPVVIALGSNLGDRLATLTAAARELAELPGLDISARSGIVETDPVGGPEQADYLNAVLVGRTGLGAAELLAALHRIEAAHGRVRTVRWGERTLDLDLIQYGAPGDDDELRSDDPALAVPHPRAHERAFVLLPWAQADPEALVRVGDAVLPVAERLAALDTDGVRPGPAWPGEVLDGHR